MSNNTIRVQFRISGEVAEFVQDYASKKRISDNESAKELLTDRCINGDEMILTALKSSVRQLTILQRYISVQLGDEIAAELLANAHGDEIEILKGLGVYNGE